MPRVTFEAKVSDVRDRKRNFTFHDDIPAEKLAELRSSKQQGEAYMTSKVNSFMPHMIQACNWACSARDECQAKAVRLVCTSMSYLHKEPPLVHIIPAIPICMDPDCDLAATNMANQLTKMVMENAESKDTEACQAMADPQLVQCAHCQRRAALGHDMARCSACKKTYYCNRECQKADWKRHKSSCAR
jgi:hypothetical protein